MRSPSIVRTFQTTTGQEIQVCLASPHQFILNHQQQLLPDWKIPIAHLILLLQQSSVSLKEFNFQVAQEKDNLRANFIRFGCDLIFALQDRGYKSDLFDPRTGYPLFSRQGKLTLNDNEVVKALLKYPLASYKNCSLLTHPVWGNNVYPGTIATVAPQNKIDFLMERFATKQCWIVQLNDF